MVLVCGPCTRPLCLCEANEPSRWAGRRAAVSGCVEVSTWVTATIARLLGVVFGEIRAAAQARRGCHGERVARPSHVRTFFSTRFNRKIDTARPRRLMQKCAIGLDLSVWERPSVYSREQGWIVSHVIAKLWRRVYRLSLSGLWGDECALGAMQPLLHSSV